MAIRADITADDNWFTGEDKSFVFTVYQSDNVTPQDVSGWTLSWTVRPEANQGDDAILTKTTGSGIAISGSYNVSPALNTQVVTVTVAKADTVSLRPVTYKSGEGGRYRHELKRTDSGSNLVVSYGTAILKQAAHLT